jgi:hypothetical protein
VLGYLREFRSKSAQNARRHVNQHDAGDGGIDPAELGFQHRANEHCQCGGEFNPSWAGANQDKGQKILVPAGIFFCFRLLKCWQHFIADANRVRQPFQAGRELWEFIVAKVTVRDPSSHNQDVIAKGNILLVLIADIKTLCIFIDSAASPRITVVFLCFCRSPRIGDAIWAGESTVVATW